MIFFLPDTYHTIKSVYVVVQSIVVETVFSLYLKNIQHLPHWVLMRQYQFPQAQETFGHCPFK